MNKTKRKTARPTHRRCIYAPLVGNEWGRAETQSGTGDVDNRRWIEGCVADGRKYKKTCKLCNTPIVVGFHNRRLVETPADLGLLLGELLAINILGAEELSPPLSLRAGASVVEIRFHSIQLCNKLTKSTTAM